MRAKFAHEAAMILSTVARTALFVGHRPKKNPKGGPRGDRNGASAADALDDEDSASKPAFDIAPFDAKMRQAVEHTKKELSAIRLGRASPALLDAVKFTHQGTTTQLSNIAQINVKDAQTLMVVVSDEQLLRPAEKAIRDSSLGFNPQVVPPLGIKVAVPKLTQEIKGTMTKNIRQIGENHRMRVRSARADARTALKRVPKSVSSDKVQALEKSIQALTDQYSKEIDALVAAKEEELN
ncbi:hypothetical protein HK105_208574 [Polyrhizophydium stewartii]|uniref:Ribosome recycling factor domain-containing protein n=1 Tax=Polyrhizophydium stewartii TaxID=2732419 RepID=A0ABR4MXG6_9FUNG